MRVNQAIKLYNWQVSFVELLKPQILWEKDKENIFNLNKEFEIKFDNCIPLNEICSSYFGIQAYDRKISITTKKINDDHLPIIDGGDINNFAYSTPNKYFNFLAERIKSGGNYKVYNEKRIVISQIGFTPIVGICEKGILGSNTLYNINLKQNSSYHLNFLLSILNSSLLKAYWISKYSDGKKLFPKIKGFQLKELPIKVTQVNIQIPFVENANLMLSLNNDLQKINDSFISLLQSKFRIEKISKKVEKWYALDFGQFLEELKKKKVQLRLSEEAEWMQYFNEQKGKAQNLKFEIDKTYSEIDRMVYELYGLTEDEIKIVKEATA